MEADEDFMDDDYYEEEEDAFHDDDIDLGFHPIQPAQQQKKPYAFDYEVYDIKQIEAIMNKDIDHLKDIFHLPRQDAAHLLRSYHWKKEKLIDDYSEDSQKVLYACGILNPGLERFLKEPPSADFTCSICFCSLTEEDPLEFVLLRCQHAFCTQCLLGYLRVKVWEEQEVEHLTCLEQKCQQIIGQDLIKEIDQRFPGEKLTEKWQESVRRHWVDKMDAIKWCPGVDCTCALVVQKSDIQKRKEWGWSITCHQQHHSCFGCGLEPHLPCLCSLAKLWVKKCADDSETANWISANTKECTNCQATIEKNGGCNHMTCKNCKSEFCWVCMGPWSEHGSSWYNCNRFDEKSSKDARDVQNKSRASLERYLHYFNRYANHEQSYKLASEFYMKTEKKMEEMQWQSEFSWIEVQFLKKSLDVVLQCRQTLKWTYAMAYYMARNNETQLFEDNQRDLEMAVEVLNELIEQPMPEPEDPQQKEKLMKMKQEVLDKTMYCQKRNEVLLLDTWKGVQEGRWQYQSQ